MATSNDNAQRVRTRTLSWDEMVKRAWGDEWAKPDVAYEFSTTKAGGMRQFHDNKNGGPYNPDAWED